LAVPPRDGELRLDITDYSAVQLFLSRAQAAEPHFHLSPEAMTEIGTICRRLDGVPLAIELAAAARVVTLGVEELSTWLDDRFGLLTGGRRTAHARQQTLKATLDWSYQLLAEQDRAVLRRLAIFPSSFSLIAAMAVAGWGAVTEADVPRHVTDLASKSLVMTEPSAIGMRFRLLETMRAYAREHLVASGELEDVARRQALICRDTMEHAEAAWEIAPSREWVAAYAVEIENIRLALDWTLTAGHDAVLGIELISASLSLLLELSLHAECCTHARQALARLGAIASSDLHRELRLQAALAMSLIYTASVEESGPAWSRTLSLAEQEGEVEYQLRALYGLWRYHAAREEYQKKLTYALRFERVASDHDRAPDCRIGDRMIAAARYYLGEQFEARTRLERFLAAHTRSEKRSARVRFSQDQRASALTTLSGVLWLQGFPERAMSVAQSAVDEACRVAHPVSLCHALHEAACTVSEWMGDASAAGEFVDQLAECVDRHGLVFWRESVVGHVGLKAALDGNREKAIALLRSALHDYAHSHARHPAMHFIAGLVTLLLEVGDLDAAQMHLDQAETRSQERGEAWYLPELVRLRGDLTQRRERPGADVFYEQALELAHRQGACSWELRAATSMARLHRDAAAHNALRQIYGRFTEGFGTVDLEIATALLSELNGSMAGLPPRRPKTVDVH
jgi:predicted ATPase